MIIHQFSDGSQGYEYEVGDRVIVEKTIHGGWFDTGVVGNPNCRVARIPYLNRAHEQTKNAWIAATLEIHFSNDWGLVDCKVWGVKPHAEALASAKTVIES
jgi:hypothetical protein